MLDSYTPQIRESLRSGIIKENEELKIRKNSLEKLVAAYSTLGTVDDLPADLAVPVVTNGVPTPKRGRGRPRGSTNKVAKRGPGRPRGSKNKVK
jgi:hypothetical protein